MGIPRSISADTMLRHRRNGKRRWSVLSGTALFAATRLGVEPLFGHRLIDSFHFYYKVHALTPLHFGCIRLTLLFSIS
ncbi:hypothetical protein MTR_4g115210 [Medicago truncatula]|uniref:Uncharacterized protein n=1 Tax=Medicago truncatula TaxID=3880 RepID=G7JFB7_MEDTR|nr:hypothetical protein MTR_4g115210 [Medicago truncatula]